MNREVLAMKIRALLRDSIQDDVVDIYNRVFDDSDLVIYYMDNLNETIFKLQILPHELIELVSDPRYHFNLDDEFFIVYDHKLVSFNSIFDIGYLRGIIDPMALCNELAKYNNHNLETMEQFYGETDLFRQLKNMIGE